MGVYALVGSEPVRTPAISSPSANVGIVVKGVMPGHRATAGGGLPCVDEEGGVPAAFGVRGGEATMPCSMSLSSLFEVDDDIIIVNAKNEDVN